MSLLFPISGEPVNLLPHSGQALFFHGFFPTAQSDQYFNSLQQEINWKQEPIRIFGKEIMQPRLTASFADEGISYGYSGIVLQSSLWTNTLLEIKKRVEEMADEKFNTALLNYYRNGQDSMGWHRDNEKELGINPVIASVSFGSERIFQFREYNGSTKPLSFVLGHGDLLIMRGQSQHHWQHRIPKSASAKEPRINITFRKIKI